MVVAPRFASAEELTKQFKEQVQTGITRQRNETQMNGLNIYFTLDFPYPSGLLPQAIIDEVITSFLPHYQVYVRKNKIYKSLSLTVSRSYPAGTIACKLKFMAWNPILLDEVDQESSGPIK